MVMRGIAIVSEPCDIRRVFLGLCSFPCCTMVITDEKVGRQPFKESSSAYYVCVPLRVYDSGIIEGEQGIKYQVPLVSNYCQPLLPSLSWMRADTTQQPEEVS